MLDVRGSMHQPLPMLQRFLNPTSPSLKICGVTRADEAAKLAKLGVHALGVNFWPNSKRYVDPAQAQHPAAKLAAAAWEMFRLQGSDRLPLFCGGAADRDLVRLGVVALRANGANSDSFRVGRSFAVDSPGPVGGDHFHRR